MNKVKKFLSRVLRPQPVESLKPGAVHELVTSINESAKQTAAILLTFVVTSLYIAVTAASTTDLQLLLDTPLTLPLLGVGVSVTSFYTLSPFLVLFLHLNLLLQEYFVAYRIYRLPLDFRKDAAEDAAELDRLFIIPSVMMRLAGQNQPMITTLLRIVFLAATAALPVLVLTLIQLKFLPYHDDKITRIHRLVVAGDIALIWLFFWFRPRPQEKARKKHPLFWPLEISFCVLASVAVLVYSLWIAIIPMECSPGNRWLDRMTAKLASHRNLVVMDRILASQEPAAELLAVHAGGNDFSPEVVWKMFSQGVILLHRDLRCADFSRSRLINADFRGSDLRGAKFLGSVLQGANFGPLGATDLRLPKDSVTDSSAVIHLYPEQKLTPSKLEGANFTGANLREANFRLAQMNDARFDSADLRMADLSSASLDGARLIGARLFASDLNSASLRGAKLQGAQLQGANLRRAQAEFASLEGATLDGAELSGITAAGSDLARASLRGASGVPLQGIDLRQANLTHVPLCGKGILPSFVDLRSIETDSERGLPLASEKLAKGLSESVSPDVTGRIRNIQAILPICPPDARSGANSLMYTAQQGTGDGYRKGWPPSMSEGAFYEAQSAFLVDVVACRSENKLGDNKPVQLALIRRIHERLTVDPKDSVARNLAVRLARKLSNSQCPNDLEDSVKAGVFHDAYYSP